MYNNATFIQSKKLHSKTEKNNFAAYNQNELKKTIKIKTNPFMSHLSLRF